MEQGAERGLKLTSREHLMAGGVVKCLVRMYKQLEKPNLQNKQLSVLLVTSVIIW